MTNKILILAIIGFIAVVILMDCQNAGGKNNQVVKESMGETNPDSQAVQPGYSNEWQNFKSTSEQKIQENENSIASFKEKMEKSGTRLKAKYNKEIAYLEEANIEMKKKLEDYKNDGKSAWIDFKTGFNNDMDKLGKAIKDLTSDND
jgi:hypothetical protein